MAIYDELFPERMLPKGVTEVRLEVHEADVVRGAALERIERLRAHGLGCQTDDTTMSELAEGDPVVVKLCDSTLYGVYMRDLLREYWKQTESVVATFMAQGMTKEMLLRERAAERAPEVYSSICWGIGLRAMVEQGGK